MIEKMKFLSTTDPEEDIDRVVDTYLSRYEIHLENALPELKTVKDLRPYIETNPYKDVLGGAPELLKNYYDPITDQMDRKTKLEEAVEIISGLDTQLKELTEWKNALVRQRDELRVSGDKVIPFAGFNYNAKEILKFRFIKFRFGRISRECYEKFSSYVYETIDTVVSKCREEGDYVQVVHFIPESLADKINAIYASMHFERCFLPDEYEGTSVEARHALDDRIGSLQRETDKADRKAMEAMSNRKEEFAVALRRIRTFSTDFDVRKVIAVTKHDTHNFYILCGWVMEKDAKTFQKEIERNSDTFYIIEDDHGNVMSTPPTKMKNSGLFRPFEMCVEMYGLPPYNKLDSTILTGMTYSILSGFMFGDAGQGLYLLIGRSLLYRLKKIRLAGIISYCSVFPTIFGLPFGDVFGFESIVNTVWLRPQETMVDLSFIGRLNTVLIAVVATGMGIILLCITLSIIDNLHSHDVEKAYSDTNGMAGLVFYFALISVIVLYIIGNLLPATVVLVVMFLILLLVVFSREPLAATMEKGAEWMETGSGMFITRGVFKLFEVLLNYFSNTLSFVRVGVLVMNHVTMMQMALMLVGAETGGNTSWVMVVDGNLFVCGMEDLIVGTWVLRLEYYGLFSRFYRGGGKVSKSHGEAAGEQ